MVKYTIMYTPKEGRGYNPRQRWGVGSLINCLHIFGLYYKACVNGRFIVKPVIIYTPTQGRGYNPRQQRRGFIP